MGTGAKSKCLGHFSTVWDIETVKCLIDFSTGKVVSADQVTSDSQWDDIVSLDIIILASEDGFIRMFMKPKELANKTMKHLHSVFEKEVYDKVSSIQNPDVLREQLKSFDPISKLTTLKGKSEGEVRVFRDGQTGKAYMWQQNEWKYIGNMISGPEGDNQEMFGGKKYYEGDRFFPKGNYDYVFDIEDQGGVQKKLPFNKGDNPLIASEKFLAREKWSVTFKEQIMNFINNNVRGGNVPSQSTPTSNNFEQLTETKPLEWQQEMKTFPIYGIETFYRKMNSEGMLKKITEINSKIIDEEYKIKMTDFELDVLSGTINELKEFHPTRDIQDREMSIIIKKLMQYEGMDSIPIIDLFRVFVLHHSSISHFDCLDSGKRFIMYCLRNYSVIKKDAKMGSKVLLTILKIFCNMFKCNQIGFLNCETIIQTFFSQILNETSNNGLVLILHIIHNLSQYLVLSSRKNINLQWVFNLFIAISDICVQDKLIIAINIIGNLIYLNPANASYIKSSPELMNLITQAKLNENISKESISDITNFLN